MFEVQVQNRREACSRRRSAIFEGGCRPSEAVETLVPSILAIESRGE